LIDKARKAELRAFAALVCGRSVERTIGRSIGLFSSIAMFVVASVTVGSLTTPKIFSVLELQSVLSMSVLYIVLGVAFFDEAKAVLGRFSLVFRLEYKTMIEIDKETKKHVIKSSDRSSDSNNRSNKHLVTDNGTISIENLYHPLPKVHHKNDKK
jgi:hypothetical protein